MSTSTPRHLFELDGGRLSLDFANTLGGMRGVRPNEHLSAYGDLVEFARQAGVVSEEHAARLARRAEQRPSEAEATFRRALELREAIYRTWREHVAKRPPPARDIELLNQHYVQAMSRQRLIPAEHGCCALAWEESDALDVVLWPIARDAVELLTSEASARVRICEASTHEECSWVFLDETRNRSRRWCSMASCGNRAKARRHYQKAKDA